MATSWGKNNTGRIYELGYETNDETIFISKETEEGICIVLSKKIDDNNENDERFEINIPNEKIDELVAYFKQVSEMLENKNYIGDLFPKKK